MTTLVSLAEHVDELLGTALHSKRLDLNELTLEVDGEQIKSVCTKLRDDPSSDFRQLTDICGVDYSTYGLEKGKSVEKPRFGVVYHLLSLSHNFRVRIRALLQQEQPVIDSVIEIWPIADWFEREAFDLFGIVFKGHPDLRRILTDYGFIGHPFRKDFPLSGHVEMAYDEQKGRVAYRPVTVEDRILVPRTIREDSQTGRRHTQSE
ncbi:MAG: NADH-quinone oxidoreductase subunit C [Gammaproteobacteria bacterium]|nr:NADH-quinone oxidoreductase subunit C [Gammaproteobacteria bacterium]MCY4219283.1 NADH-quinone oxidoreductase subunit C [Gammaproteobacteria bacterium]MCY4276115.1 NADH-quinone oxidoreductase subunit C [Gammaproteobacteria bacterium]